MKIINLFKKHKEEEQKEMKTISIVFNVVNHASLVAATLADICLTKAGIETTMVDIRDVFPVTDLYLWLDAGDKRTFENYMKTVVIGNPLRDVYSDVKEISEKSIFLTSEVKQEAMFENMILGRLFTYLLEKGYVNDGQQRAFTRLAMTGSNWLSGLSGKNDGIEVASYYQVLQICYRHYVGVKTTVMALELIMEGSDVGAEEYKLRQKEFGLAMSRRCRYVSVLGQGMQYLTMTGPEVFGIIRRISLSKQQYCHVSEGSYGTVVFASVAIPDKFLNDHGAFNLTGGPNHEQLRNTA